MGAAYSSLGRTKVLYAISFVLLGEKSQVPAKETKCLSCFGKKNSEMCCQTPIHIIRDSYTKVSC